ncbi:33830_t:CDS:1, partial [Gigaspora margarita]
EEIQEEHEAHLAYRRSLYYQNKTKKPVEQLNKKKFKNTINMRQRCALENLVTSQNVSDVHEENFLENDLKMTDRELLQKILQHY